VQMARRVTALQAHRNGSWRKPCAQQHGSWAPRGASEAQPALADAWTLAQLRGYLARLMQMWIHGAA